MILSLDYELYFGARHGAPERCLVEPCEALLAITRRVGARLAFFVDAGYLCKLEEYRRVNGVQREADAVFRHLDALARAGHELHLHVHPHWEDTRRGAHGWQFDLTRYALHSFDGERILDIVTRYKRAVARFVGADAVFGYRAGGFVIQPFGPLAAALRKNGVMLDSSVFPGGLTGDSTQRLDFRRCPDKDCWRFDSDPLAETPRGAFLEVPIAATRVAPHAYWQLVLRKVVHSPSHRSWGDGVAIAPGRRDLAAKLLRSTVSAVSIDGPKAAWLESAWRSHEAKGRDCFVVLGHPKALTGYSLQCLERFLRSHPRLRPVGYADYAPVAAHRRALH